MDDSEQTRDLEQVKGLSLLGASFENDSFLVNSPPRDPLGHQTSENQEETSVSNVEDTTDTFELGDQLPQLFESPEPERTDENRKYNLRQSLAWDSAFFTNAGVLDPEELSCMIRGVEKGGKNLLAGIQEDVNRSTDSFSSFESDNLTLENLEADLFGDIRASIQKSSNLSNASNSSKNLGSEAVDIQTMHSSKMELASQSKAVPKPTSKKPVVSKLGSGKITKQPSVCPEIPKGAATKGLATPSPKPPKVIGIGSPMSSISIKRASLGSDRMKKGMDNSKACTGRGTIVSKTSAISGSRSNAPRPIPTASSKSSILSSSIANKIDLRSSCSSFASSGRASSDDVSKSSLNSTKRQVNSRTGNALSSGSTLKPLPKPRNKIQTGNSQLSANLKAAPKLSSSILPASSISDLSSLSSASTSIVNQRRGSARFIINSSKGISIQRPTGNHSNDLGSGSGRNGTQTTGVQGQAIKKPVTGTSTHPESAVQSGLRLPSPKIGFFDGVKLVRTPNGTTQSSPSHVLHKVEVGRASLSGNSNKANMGKFQPARTTMAKGSTNLDTQQIALATKLKSLLPQKASNASTKTSSSNASRSASSSPVMTRKIQNKISPSTSVENLLRPEVEAKLKPPIPQESSNGSMETSTASRNKSNSSAKISLKTNGENHLKPETEAKFKPPIPHEPSNGSMETSTASKISLKTNRANHLKPEEGKAKEPDIAPYSPGFKLIVQDNSSFGILKGKVNASTRIPFAVKDSLCNKNGYHGITSVGEESYQPPFPEGQ